MLTLRTGTPARNCQGMTRRSALKAGFLGVTGLTLPDLLKLRAEGSAPRKDTAVILLWLDGGPSQLETYDPKPDAPAEYRGPFGTIKTNVTGMHISETLPLHAKHADKMIFVRSVHHDAGDHFAGAHWMLTGRFGSTAAKVLPQIYPSVGSYAAKVRGPNRAGLPAYVGLPAAQSVYLFPGYQGAAYRYLTAAVGDPDVAAELFQEFAVRFLRGDFRRAAFTWNGAVVLADGCSFVGPKRADPASAHPPARVSVRA